MKRKDELEKSAESIKDLITTLDQRKDEAIQRTFKQVSKNFEEIFGQLVESGRGRLIIQRTASYRDEETENQPTGDGGKVDTYTGVGIQVRLSMPIMLTAGLVQLEARRGAEDSAALGWPKVARCSGHCLRHPEVRPRSLLPVSVLSAVRLR
jgi:hypothetical protein